MANKRRDHWEHVYNTKEPPQVGWTQKVPQTSLDFLSDLNLDKSANIIDVGGGDSRFVDYLLEQGYENISVLDISAKAIEKAKKRLGEKAWNVKWIISDVVEFEPQERYDVWHDRASFHFLTNEEDIKKYKRLVDHCVNGYLIMGTFSDQGPTHCSGLEIVQYNSEKITNVFDDTFQPGNFITEDHITPSGNKQNYIFGSFKKR